MLAPEGHGVPLTGWPQPQGLAGSRFRRLDVQEHGAIWSASSEVCLLGLLVAVPPLGRLSHGCPSVCVCVLLSSYKDGSRVGLDSSGILRLVNHVFKDCPPIQPLLFFSIKSPLDREVE